MLRTRAVWLASALVALCTLFGLPTSATAQIRQDKLFLDDGTGLFTVLRSVTLTSGSNTVYFPNADGKFVTLFSPVSGSQSYAKGDLLFANAATDNYLTRLTAGSTGQFLTISGGVPAWTDLSGIMVTSFNGRTGAVSPASGDYSFSLISGNAASTQGGTGQTVYTTGDMLYASSTSALSKLNVGTANQVLGVSGGVPAYVNNGATITNNVTTPAELIANTNNYVIDASSTYIRVNNADGGPIELTGISSVGVANGRVITLVNVSATPANSIIIRHQSASSSAGNQFDLPGGGDIILGYRRGAATFIYDAVTGYWELESVN